MAEKKLRNAGDVIAALDQREGFWPLGWWLAYNEIEAMNDRGDFNVERIIAGIKDVCGYLISESTLWASLQDTSILGPTRKFLWKGIHGVHICGKFWDNIPDKQYLAICEVCDVPESLEHILVECIAPGTQEVWQSRWKV